MKKIVINMLSIFTLAFIINGCTPASEKHTELAKEKLNEAGEEIKEAIAASNEKAKLRATQDWETFKRESEQLITAMEKQTDELELQISKTNEKQRAELKDKLEKADKELKLLKEKLKQRSDDFKLEKEKFDESVVTKNESFKREFRHDMDELGLAFKDVFKNNVN